MVGQCFIPAGVAEADQKILLANLAANVRRLRDARDWSLMDLVRRCQAAGAKVTKNTILNLENRKLKSIRSDTIEGLAAGFGVHYAELILPEHPPAGGVSLDSFLSSDLGRGTTDDEADQLRREARLPWGPPPTMKAWLKALELVRARREGDR